MAHVVVKLDHFVKVFGHVGEFRVVGSFLRLLLLRSDFDRLLLLRSQLFPWRLVPGCLLEVFHICHAIVQRLGLSGAVQFGVCCVYNDVVTVRQCVLVGVICQDVLRCLIVCVSVLASTLP